MLNSAPVASPELKARFEREARVISQLQHPHICVLHDVGSENGTDFLVMEYLEGESLGDRLLRGVGRRVGFARLASAKNAIPQSESQLPTSQGLVFYLS